MFFFFIVFLSVLFPLVIKNKVWGFRVSIVLLFVLLGFQYQMVNDWFSNIARWYYVNEGGRDTMTGFELEPLFVWLLKVCKPLTFYGWNMLVTGVFLLLIYIYARLYVPKKYYWLTIFALMSSVGYGVLFINSNRQCTSLIFVLIGVLFIISQRKIKFKIPLIKVEWAKYIIACILFFMGAQCHSAAYVSFLLPLIWLISAKFKGSNWIAMAVICNILYFARAFIDVTWIQDYADLFITSSDVGHVEGYLENMDSSEASSTVTGGIVTFSIITIFCYYYRSLPRIIKFFSLSWFFGYLVASYFNGNVNRLGEYFYIFFIFAMPNIFSLVIREKNRSVKTLGLIAFALYLGYNTIHCYTQMHTYLYHRWLNYKSVFNAPVWE